MSTLLARSLRFSRVTAALAVAVLLLIGGCRKPDDDLGGELLPGDPLAVVIDTVELHAFTFRDTSIRTNALSRHLVGSYMDPQFGLLKTGIVAQIRLSANDIGVGQSGLVADSLVLSLAFDGLPGVYGNLNPQVFQVFEVNETLSLDSSYRTDRVTDVLPEDLVAERGRSITPHPTRRVMIGTDSLAPQLRIKLDQSLADRFLLAFGSPVLANSEAFLEFFKGLYVTVDHTGQAPYQGGILYFNLISPASKAVLYYRDTDDQPELTRTLDFPINSNSVRYTVAEHDYAVALDQGITQALADHVQPATTTYVQTLGGTRTAIRIPDILEYATSERLLAKAELVAPLQGTHYSYYPPPPQLVLFRKDTAGLDAFLPDQFAGLGIIDGNFRSSENAYRFNITRYVQQVITGTMPNTGFELVPGSGGVSANRVVFNGPASPMEPMRLRLTFTSY